MDHLKKGKILHANICLWMISVKFVLDLWPKEKRENKVDEGIEIKKNMVEGNVLCWPVRSKPITASVSYQLRLKSAQITKSSHLRKADQWGAKTWRINIQDEFPIFSPLSSPIFNPRADPVWNCVLGKQNLWEKLIPSGQSTKRLTNQRVWGKSLCCFILSFFLWAMLWFQTRSCTTAAVAKWESKTQEKPIFLSRGTRKGVHVVQRMCVWGKSPLFFCLFSLILLPPKLPISVHCEVAWEAKIPWEVMSFKLKILERKSMGAGKCGRNLRVEKARWPSNSVCEPTHVPTQLKAAHVWSPHRHRKSEHQSQDLQVWTITQSLSQMSD